MYFSVQLFKKKGIHLKRIVIDHVARISYDVATNQVWLQGIFNKFKFARRNFRYGAADDTYGRSIYTGTNFEQLSKYEITSKSTESYTFYH